jgi:CRISPR/Cas system CSM-associated protein Csm3 (group 7 of RAMP superfamily)
LKQVIGVFGSLLVVAIIYGIVNLVLVGGQNLWHSGDKKAMSNIEVQLKNIEDSIHYYELKNKDGLISDEEYDTYKAEVAKCNELVKEYNKHAEKAGTTWYVVPIPGGRD